MLVEQGSYSGPDVSVPAEVGSQDQTEGLLNAAGEDYSQVVIADAGLDITYNGLASQISGREQDDESKHETARNKNEIVALHLAGLVAVASTVAIFGRKKGKKQDRRYKGLSPMGVRLQQKIDAYNISGEGWRPTAQQRKMIEQEVTGPMEEELSSLYKEIGKLEKSAKRTKNSQKKGKGTKRNGS